MEICDTSESLLKSRIQSLKVYVSQTRLDSHEQEILSTGFQEILELTKAHTWRYNIVSQTYSVQK